MKANHYNSKRRHLGIYLSLLFSILFISSMNAQDYVVTTAETWYSNQTLSTNVIVDAGGTLTIAAGVTVGFNYSDVNADSTGDFRIEVKNGGKLIVNGTLTNPVVFQGTGSNPPAYAGSNKWWQGLIMTSTAGSSINFLTIKNVSTAIQVKGALDISGLTIDGANTGIVASNTLGGTVNINAPTLTNIAGKGIVVNNGATNIRYATISNTGDNGIEVNAPNVTIDWATITNTSTGIYNTSTATNTVISNSSVTNNLKSGLFILDGGAIITNSIFNNNAFHGIVNSSGNLTLSRSDVSNNISRGLLLAGAGTSTIKNITDTANGDVGVDIITQKQPADVLAPAGTVEAAMPIVSFLYSNIYNNSKTSTPSNLQVRSLATSMSPVADFTTTWWGVSTGVMDLISVVVPGSVNYANWRISGPYAEVSTANLNLSKSITMTYPVSNQKLLRGESLNVTWTSVGKIPFVIVNHVLSAGPTTSSYDVVANTGSFKVTPSVADPNVTFNVKCYSADSSIINSSASAIAIVIPTTHPITSFAAAPAPRAATYITVTTSTVGLTNGSTVTITGATGASASVYNGTFAISNVAAGSFEIPGTFGAAGGAAATWSFPAPTMQINRPIASDTLRSNAKFKVKWVAPAVVKNLDIYFSLLGDFSDEVKVGTSVDATLGSYEITAPATVTKGVTAKIKLKDVTPNVTNVSSISSFAFNTFANPPWTINPSGYSMNIAVDTLIFAGQDPNLADVKTENFDSYLGAFWTNSNGQRVCVGYTQGIDPIVPFSASPIAITAVAAAAAPNAATYVTVSTASTYGLTNGRTVTIAGCTPTTYNGVFVVTNVVANTSFDINIPIGAALTVPGTWTLNYTNNIISFVAGAPTTVNVASTSGILAGDPVTISGSNNATYDGTVAVSNITPTSFDIPTAFVAVAGRATTSIVPSAAPRATTHLTVATGNTAGLVNGGTVTLAGSDITSDNGVYTVSNVVANTSFEIASSHTPVATTSIIVSTANPATDVTVSVPDITVFGTLQVGDLIQLAGSSVAALNTVAPMPIISILGNTFDVGITVPSVNVTASASGGGNSIVVTAASIAGLSVGSSVTISGADGADAALVNGTHVITGLGAGTFTFLATGPWSATITTGSYKINDVSGTATWAAFDAAHATYKVNEYRAHAEFPAHRYRSLTIWGDDPTTSAIKEGPAEGDNVTFSLYQAGYTPASNPDGVLPARISLDTTIAMSVPNNNDFIGGTDSLTSIPYHLNSFAKYFSIFSREGYGQVSAATTGTVSRAEAYPAAGAWYLYSTNILPVVSTFAPQPLTGSFTESFGTNILIAKSGAGDIYWPKYGINQIDSKGGWRYDQAYYIKVGDPAGLAAGTVTFTLTGSKISPEASPVNLNAGWNYIPYLRESSMNISIALSSISTYIVIVKQDDGKVYWPAYSINEIGNMTAGKGYMVKVSDATTLKYPSNSYVGKESAVAAAKNNVHFVVKTNSDNSSILGILADALDGKVQIDDEVGVFNSDGVLVGSSVYNGGNIAVTVWGLESGAKAGFGMKESEAYSIKVWNKATGKETLLAGATYTMGNGYYSTNGISVISKIEGLTSVIPTEYAVAQNYPNPFNPSTVISFALPVDSKVKISIYNVIGQHVTDLVNTEMKAGYHKINFNASGLASGVYFYNINAGKFNQTMKMNLLK